MKSLEIKQEHVGRLVEGSFELTDKLPSVRLGEIFAEEVEKQGGFMGQPFQTNPFMRVNMLSRAVGRALDELFSK